MVIAMNIVELIKNAVIMYCEEYKNNSSDKYDFWNQHIKYVYNRAIELANKYNADIEIVSLGALLHDIALIKKVGTRADHHINGKMMAEDILSKYGYEESKSLKVLECIYNHRSSLNAESVEEICVADADTLAHFDNIPMLFNSAFVRNKINLNEVREWMKNTFEKDYNDLSEKQKKYLRKGIN